MKRGTPRHPKVLELSLALGIPKYSIIGLLEMLWHFTAEFALDGGVGKFSDAMIGEALCWDGDSTVLVSAMVKTGWLDCCKCHRLRVHDWPNHADQTVRRVLTNRKQAFASCYDDASMMLAPCADDTSTVLEPSKLPLPKALSLKPIANTYSALARDNNKNEYVGDKDNDAKRIVALIMEHWDNWPQDQVEATVMKLRSSDRELTFGQWEEIISEAYRTCPPEKPTYQLHSWLANAVTFWKRNRARQREIDSKKPHPPPCPGYDREGRWTPSGKVGDREYRMTWWYDEANCNARRNMDIFLEMSPGSRPYLPQEGIDLLNRLIDEHEAAGHPWKIEVGDD